MIETMRQVLEAVLERLRYQVTTYLPPLLAALKEQAGVTPLTAERRLLPFDEVFVRLIQQADRDL